MLYRRVENSVKSETMIRALMSPVLTLRHEVFLPSDEKWARYMFEIVWCRMRNVVGAISGHCGINGHLTRMGLVNDQDSYVKCECTKFFLFSPNTRKLGGSTLNHLQARTCISGFRLNFSG